MRHARTHNIQLSGPTVHSLYCGQCQTANRHIALGTSWGIPYTPTRRVVNTASNSTLPRVAFSTREVIHLNTYDTYRNSVMTH